MNNTNNISFHLVNSAIQKVALYETKTVRAVRVLVFSLQPEKERRMVCVGFFNNVFLLFNSAFIVGGQ